MSVQEYLGESTANRCDRCSIGVDRRILVAYPGDVLSFNVRVESPRGCLIRVAVRGLPNSVASVSVGPDISRAPFTLTITIAVDEKAPPGSYPFNVEVYSVDEGALLGVKHLALIILDRRIPKAVAGRLDKLRELYRKYGAQVTVWYLLSQIFTEGATFGQLKSAYESIVGRKVSNGTMGNILERMLKKRIIAEKYPGVYVSNVKDIDTLFSRIDVSRVRPQAYSGRNAENSRRSPATNEGMDFAKLPKPVERTWLRAQEIAQKHGALTALYFLLRSFLGAEATGQLLYWSNTWFVVCRSKTGFCYHFYSPLLHEMLKSLGLVEGLQYNYFRVLEQAEAQRTAQKYIRMYYQSHPNARRLHYMLKEEGYIWYDDNVYTLKIYYYRDGSAGLEVYNDSGEKLIYRDSIKDEKPLQIATKTAFPFEHIDEENEETYFYRPAGLY